MVYEQDGQRWIFFHDLFGQWQWTRVDDTGATLEQAARSFRTFCLCIKDARTRGFSMRRSRSIRVRDTAMHSAVQSVQRSGDG